MTIEITFKHDAEKYPTSVKGLLKKYGLNTEISNEEAVKLLQDTPAFVKDTEDYRIEREEFAKLSNEEIKKLPQCDEKWLMKYEKSKITITDEKTEMVRKSKKCEKLEESIVLETVARAMAIPFENTGPNRAPRLLYLSKEFNQFANTLEQYLAQFNIECEVDGKSVKKDTKKEEKKDERIVTPEQEKAEKEAEELKKLGNIHFVKKENKEAVEVYSKALEKLNQKDLYDNNEPKEILGVVYSNRSAAYLLLNENEKALEDAENAIKYKPTWDKGYYRKTKALLALNRKKDAIKDLCKALKNELTKEEEKRILKILIDVTGLNSEKLDDIIDVIEDYRYKNEDSLLIVACHQLSKLIMNEPGLFKKKEQDDDKNAQIQAQEITDRLIQQLAASEKATANSSSIDAEISREQIIEEEPEWAGEEEMIIGFKKMAIQKEFVESGYADKLGKRFIQHKNPVLQQYGKQFAETAFAWSEEGQKAYNEHGYELFAEDLGIGGAMRMGFF